MKYLSDGRYMQKPQDLSGVLAAVTGLTVRSCDDATGMGARRYSLCGEEVAKVFPHAATTDGVGMYRVDYEMLVPVLVQAIKELAAQKAATTKKKTTKSE
ncbi:hypothetical protein [Paratractidigestivibacter sp.]|uniref:hypothetical protein n=1 Tax=Paratractidigestivibacter sp. TaxID=2847316 RepID=UPI002AC92344|nr:hypothetical protein [Paratractidigestivibacter sp.]